ncbi:MAG TPA: HK97 family phage prohead protease [Sphingomicrobium sp.]|nr:HK97 family phage prohead protease [Sphingomicrobium sp.]
MQNRAYSRLEIKAVDDGKRIIRGVATTPTVDRVGDIIDPLGVEFDNPLSFLWMHDHETPVGDVVFDKPTKDGITFTAEFVHPDVVESATLKDRLQLAWDSVKTGLVRAVSIGFRPLEWAFIDGGGIRYDVSEVYELSAVTIPANADALISGVKSLYGATDIDIVKALDAEARREHGIPDPEIPEQPKEVAATGKTLPVVKLASTARDRAPFVITKIHPERKHGQ